jgi:hypothetical protein
MSPEAGQLELCGVVVVAAAAVVVVVVVVVEDSKGKEW